MVGRVRMTEQTERVLRAMADDPRSWHYGYELLARTGMKSGSLYPILLRLAEHGHIESAWEADPPHGRPPRHHYRLTQRGLDAVAAMRSAPLQAASATRTTGSTRAAAGTRAAPWLGMVP